MKKILLMGIICFGAFAMFLTGVKAETINLENVSETGQIVTVGEVDAPVYSVDITWGDMTYDYKYNAVTKEFEWKSKDDDLQSEMSPGHIVINDNSKYGQIIPSIFWNSENKYNFVNAEFYYEGPVCKVLSEEDFESYKDFPDFPNGIFIDNNCSIKTSEENPIFVENKYYSIPFVSLENQLIGNQLPENARIQGAENMWYHIILKLINDPSKETVLPTAGDIIGRVTISIDAK